MVTRTRRKRGSGLRNPQKWEIHIKIPKCLLDLKGARIRQVFENFRENLEEIYDERCKSQGKFNKIEYRAVLDV